MRGSGTSRPCRTQHPDCAGCGRRLPSSSGAGGAGRYPFAKAVDRRATAGTHLAETSNSRFALCARTGPLGGLGSHARKLVTRDRDLVRARLGVSRTRNLHSDRAGSNSGRCWKCAVSLRRRRLHEDRRSRCDAAQHIGLSHRFAPRSSAVPFETRTCVAVREGGVIGHAKYSSHVLKPVHPVTSCHGFTKSAPVDAKSAILRVTIVRPFSKAVAAINASRSDFGSWT